MPSKKVFIKRNRPFIHEQLKSAEAQEYLSYSKRSIGSYYANKNSQRKGTGLTDEEVKLLLPQILDIRPDDIEFRKKVDLFYQEINTPIPFERGLELEIGLEIDNKEAPTYYIETEVIDRDGKNIRNLNMPINVDDYIKYRHALKHPHVASSPEEAKGNQTVDYYVEDPERVMEAKVNAADYADKALIMYQQIRNEPDKIKMILSLLRAEIPRKSPGQPVIVDKLTAEESVLAIRLLALNKPTIFLRVAEDKNLRKKYLLDELISVQLLKRAGSSILVSSSGDPLGATDEDAIKNLFDDPAKAPLLSSLKESYKDIKEKQKYARVL